MFHFFNLESKTFTYHCKLDPRCEIIYKIEYFLKLMKLKKTMRKPESPGSVASKRKDIRNMMWGGRAGASEAEYQSLEADIKFALNLLLPRACRQH